MLAQEVSEADRQISSLPASSDGLEDLSRQSQPAQLHAVPARPAGSLQPMQPVQPLQPVELQGPLPENAGTRLDGNGVSMLQPLGQGASSAVGASQSGPSAPAGRRAAHPRHRRHLSKKAAPGESPSRNNPIQDEEAREGTVKGERLGGVPPLDVAPQRGPPARGGASFRRRHHRRGDAHAESVDGTERVASSQSVLTRLPGSSGTEHPPAGDQASSPGKLEPVLRASPRTERAEDGGEQHNAPPRRRPQRGGRRFKVHNAEGDG